MKTKISFGGIAAGFINGLLGSGGGMLVVPTLSREGLDRKRAHCTSLAVMLPLSALSAGIYLTTGSVSFAHVLPYLPGGVLGALAGGFIMRRINPRLLRRIFGGFALWAGVRLLLP